MKNVFIVVFMVAGVLTGRLLAQGHEQAGREKMKVFSDWVGHWQGEGTLTSGPGEAKRSTVDERIEWKLDGMVLMVEGIGKMLDEQTRKETVVHHAFAVLSFDQRSGDYNFRTYLNDGRSTDAWLKVVGLNQYQWGFETPGGKIRYNILMDPLKKTWNETGEFSQDGISWREFLVMNLRKVD